MAYLTTTTQSYSESRRVAMWTGLSNKPASIPCPNTLAFGHQSDKEDSP